jgi:phage terminase large subunit
VTEAAARIAAWRADPLAFVRECFGVEPDAWQADVLAAFPTHPRIAMKACKGPGKTTVLAWIAWNFLLTRLRPKIAACSISADNLADGLWTEMAKWQAKSPLLRSAFTWGKTRIEAADSNLAPEWWMSARTWSRSADAQTQGDTLAGLHADNLLFIVDEAGGIPDAVVVAADAGLANAGQEDREAHLVIAGNPTHLEGPLYRACTSARDLWYVVEITSDPDDPKRTPRVPAEWAREQIKQYGRDNPWVLVNVFGKFPPSSLNSLLGPDEVAAARNRKLQPIDYEHSPKVLGVDVAREGDDRSVIVMRQGMKATVLRTLRNQSSDQGAGEVARAWAENKADACFIDNTGGFGGGWIDQLRLLGRNAIPIHFAGKANDMRYANKRAEMHFLLAEWVKQGGQLYQFPDEIVAELTMPTYSFKGDTVLLEPKDDIKERLGRSPDLADALALTFAQPVYKPSVLEGLHMIQRERVNPVLAWESKWRKR